MIELAIESTEKKHQKDTESRIEDKKEEKEEEEEEQWLAVCPYGIMSSSKTVKELCRRLKIPESTTIFEVGGADYALRTSPWRYNKPFICLGRTNVEYNYTHILRMQLKDLDINPNFIFIQSEVADISSTLIRYMYDQERSEILERGLLEPNVYEYLKILWN